MTQLGRLHWPSSTLGVIGVYAAITPFALLGGIAAMRYVLQNPEESLIAMTGFTAAMGVFAACALLIRRRLQRLRRDGHDI